MGSLDRCVDSVVAQWKVRCPQESVGRSWSCYSRQQRVLQTTRMSCCEHQRMIVMRWNLDSDQSGLLVKPVVKCCADSPGAWPQQQVIGR
jgi:hypothetical protein